VFGLAIAWVLFVPVADWLAHHDVGSVKGPLHETAMDNARGRVLTLAAGVAAAGALAFTALNFTLSRRTFELTEQGQVTERYTKAIEQLGSKELDIRIGGIYALERIARDSARDHPTVVEVLTAFIREHSQEPWSLPAPTSRRKWIIRRARFRASGREQERHTRPDVQAAVTVLGRRDAKRDIRAIDLTGADLTRADLGDADLHGADLSFANLTGADLLRTDLTDADLPLAHLTDAQLSFANLTEANLTDADLTHAQLVCTDLRLASLTGADLTRADLREANLTGADLTDADLGGATPTRANLIRADLTGARWPEDAPVPEGWKRDTSSGRLERATTDSGPAEAS
jgi:hypothetical protein